MSKEKLKREKQNRTSHLAPHTSQKGITLIALIITIIVMLILVGVSVTVALNGGLFSTANQATTQTKDALEREQMQASGRIKIGDTWYDSAEDYAKGEPSANQGGWKQEGDKIKYVDGAGKEVTTITIGDYVNYDEGTSRSHRPDNGKGAGIVITTAYGSTSAYPLGTGNISIENLTWRVLGINNKGEIELISTNPTSQMIYLANTSGYLNVEYNLNNFCNDLYGKGKYATSARSLNVEDINKLANYDPTTYKGYGVEWAYRFSGASTKVQYSNDGGTTWADTNYAAFRTPELYPAINSSNPGSQTLKHTYYGYNIVDNITAEDGFENPTEISDMICKNHWLASSSISCGSSNASFGVYFLTR